MKIGKLLIAVILFLILNVLLLLVLIKTLTKSDTLKNAELQITDSDANTNTISNVNMNTTWKEPSRALLVGDWQEVSSEQISNLTKTVYIETANIETPTILTGKAYVLSEVKNIADVDLLKFSSISDYRKGLEDNGWYSGTVSVNETEVTGVSSVHPASQYIGYVKANGNQIKEIVINTSVFGSDGKLYISGSQCPCVKKATVFISDPVVIE